MKLIFLASFFGVGLIYILGSHWTINDIYEKQGTLVLPIVNISLKNIFHKDARVILEGLDKSTLIQFNVPQTQVIQIMKECQEFNSSAKPAQAKVIFQKNFWGQVINPYLVLTEVGWVRQPK
jgi:hypothetical protein